MQTLRLTHRLDLRRVGVSGDAIAKQASESRLGSEPKLEITLGVNYQAKQHHPLGNKTKSISLHKQTIFVLLLRPQ